ncbi:MAG: ATP F0F1 synthase subunit B [Alphaproteobacteria bacterium]|nr:ATP F0F1 synthase subunit B [Alphaproteobacteria bacterium]
MPQLDPEFFGPQLIWLAITFGLLYLLVSKICLPPIVGTMQSREDRIAGDLDRAEDLKQEAEEALATYEQALAEARAKAHQIALETREQVQADIDKAQAEADAKLAEQTAEAEKRIRAAREEALAQVPEIASEAASAIVGKLMGKAPSSDAVNKAVEEEFSRQKVA